MIALANTLVAIDSGVLSLSICASLAKSRNHSCILRDRERSEATLLLQLSDVLMAKPESSKGGEILKGKRQFSRVHHRIG
jgi:hypothetical protein